MDTLHRPLPDSLPSDPVPMHGLVFGEFLRPHLRGDAPFLVEVDLATTVDARAVLPADARIRQVHRRGTSVELLAEHDGCLVLIRTWRSAADLWVSGADEVTVDRIVEDIRGRVPAPEDPGTHRVTFWQQANRGQWSRSRDLTLPSWSDVRHHYPQGVQDAMGTLTAFRPGDGPGGRLVLWHGPPGTGKTTAVRALLHAWADWASPHVVSDPEVLLSNGAYLSNVLLDADSDDDERRRAWRIVVIEDAEELLRRDARSRVGPALGRLLNTADGLLGQGSQAIILLTTNELVGDLHPALLRPGRCLARMEFPALSRDEASALLGRPATGPMTLAEVMEAQGGLQRVDAVTAVPVQGVYL